MKGNHFKKFKTVLIAMLFIVISGYMLISTAIAALAQDVDVSKVKNVVDINLEKYVNYNLESKKGTLLQLNVKTGIEYEEGTEYVPLSSTGILLNVPKINNKFPQSVEVFEKSTKATNGDEQGKDVRYKYVSETGQLVILTANEEQNGEIYKEYVKGAKDDISIVLDYDETCRFEENTKNELDITGFVQTKLATQKETKVQNEIKAKVEVEKQVSNLVSSDVKTSDIYNGFIKMNAKNNSNYKTTYNESFGINISKKDFADETKIEIENALIKNEEKTVIKDISYISSKINKNKVLDVLGQDGYFKVLDENGNVLAEINKDTQVDQEGNYEIKYANGISKIFAVFSKPNKVGYIKINSTKEIQSSFKEVDVNKLQVVSKISSVNKVKDAQNNEIEKVVYNFEDTKEIEIKNTQTLVKASVNNAKWTNQKQNDIEFNVKLLASESNHSLFKNPIIKIQVPEEVEKVVLGNVKVTNGNGLSFKNIEYNKENRIITVTLEGEQTEYLSKNLADGTNVIIPASVILGQEIESKNTKIGVGYLNEATSETGTFKLDVEVENFRQVQNQENEITNAVPTVVRQVQRAALRSETPNVETAEGVEIEVVPTRCTDILNNGDTVYEGEFIKYSIKVKNTTDHDLENVKLVADLPDGVKYAKITDYYNEFVQNTIYDEVEQSKLEYDETIRQLPIDIGTLGKDKKVNKEFQVRVKDLENNETEKQIETTIKAYIGNGLSDEYKISHKVQKSDYKVSLIGYIYSRGSIQYILDISGDETDNVKLKMNLPENLSIYSIYPYQGGEPLFSEIPEDNVFQIKPGKYFVTTNIKENFKTQEDSNTAEVKASAIINDVYKSNESIILYKYENASLKFSSPTEGENLNYDQEVIYNVQIKNITEDVFYADKSITLEIKDRLPKELKPISIEYNEFTWDEDTNSFKEETKEERLYGVNEDEEEAYNVDLFMQIPTQKVVNIKIKATAELVLEDTTITNNIIVEDVHNIFGRISSNVITNNILAYDETTIDGDSAGTIGTTEPEIPLEPIIPEEGSEEPVPEEETNESDNPISQDELGGEDDIGNIPGEDENNQGDGENTGNGENQENQEQEGNGNTTDKKYSITGMAWKDENADGQQEDNEQKLSGIEVILVDSTGKNVSETTTNNDGQYAFNNLADGNYIVVFKYDTSKYRLTEYQKNGVESNYNSDVIKTEREIDGKSTICGVTNLIKLNSNLENIDIGLIENKKFNFKVENYISKITTITSNGTDSKDYNNAKLAKTEIKSKEIENASVKVEYKIVITNDGELQGTVGKVVEKLPEGLKLSSDVNNKTWYKNQDGSLVNTSMSGQIIEPGKSLELELIADVSNSSGVIGNYKDTVIIEEISNSLGITENNTEDNSSSTELIVSVSTGAIIYISIIISVIAVTGLLIFLNKKYGILKHVKVIRLFVFILLFATIVSSNLNCIEAKDYNTYDYVHFVWDKACKEHYNAYGSRCFTEIISLNPSTGEIYDQIKHGGLCIGAGLQPAGIDDTGIAGMAEYYSPKYYNGSSEWFYKEKVEASKTFSGVTFNLSTSNSQVSLKKYNDNNYLVGPLYITDKSSYNGQYYSKYNTSQKKYIFRVFFKNNKYLDFSTTYDSSGNVNSNSMSNGTNKAFYIKLTEQQISDNKGISSIKTEVEGIQTQDWWETTFYYRIWMPVDNGYQPIIGRKIEKSESDHIYKNTKTSDSLTWTIKEGSVKIKKVAMVNSTVSDTGRQVSGIQFVLRKKGNNSAWVKNGTYGAWGSDVAKLTTNSSGETGVIQGLEPGWYEIYEIYDSMPSSLKKCYKPTETINGVRLRKVQDKYVSAGILNTLEEKNYLDYVPVQLQKKDEIGDVSDLSGINFVFYKKSTGWVMQDGSTGGTYLGTWNNDNKGNISKLAKLKTDKNGLTGVLQGLEPGEYSVYEIVEGPDGYKSFDMPARLRKYYKENCTVAGCKLKKLDTTITVSKPTSSNPQKSTVTNKRDKVKLTLNKTDEFKYEKIDLSGINFLLYRQKNEYGEPDGRGWAAYDDDGLIEYISWGDSTRSNIKKLVKMTTKSKNKDGKYLTNEIEGLDRGYYTVYEFIEGCDTETNKLNLPERLRKYYKGSTSKQAGCTLKTVGYINITKGFKMLYDANGKYVGVLASNGKYYSSDDKPVSSLSYDSKKIKQVPKYDISANKGKMVADESNKRDFVDYKLHKIDSNEKVNLEGIEFKIYAHEYKDSSGNVYKAGWVKWTKNSKGVYQIDEDQSKAVTTYDKSSTLTTDKNGYTEQIEKLLVGRKYTVYEVGLGTYDKLYEIGPSNDGVKMPGTDKYGKLIETWIAKANKEGLYGGEEPNDKYYVSLSGNVWEDNLSGKSTNQSRNDKLDNENTIKENKDNNISGITVKLVDKNKHSVKQVITNSDGTYTFDKVPVSEIEAGNYHIEFLYDGITYQTVKQDKGLTGSKQVGTKTVSIPNEYTSKAGETSSRTDLNNSFTEVTGDGQYIAYNGMNRLTYNKNKSGVAEDSQIYLENTYKYTCRRTNGKNNKRGTVTVTPFDNVLKVTATIDANYLKTAYNTMKKGYKDNTKELLLTIPNLNLGLYQREQVDLGLTKDTVLAQVDINGKSYKYLYAQDMRNKLGELLGKTIKPTETSLGVAFERGGKELLDPNDKYKTAIHKADVVYDNPNGTDGELKVTITYGIGLVNNSNTLYGKINKIKEYYSSEYTLADKTIYLDPLCTKPLTGATIENESTKDNAILENETVARNYKTFDINFGSSGIVIEPNAKEQTIIYLKMELPKSQLQHFINNDVEYKNKEFRNFAEISSYTTYSAYNAKTKTGTLYATYDYDSVPNNIATTNPKLRKSEDDSDYSRGLQIVLAEERTLSGYVFKDNANSTALKLNIRQGNGYFDKSSEKGIAGVTVQLVPTSLIKSKNTKDIQQEYKFMDNQDLKVEDVNKYYENRKLSTLTYTTDADGYFEFKGILPGDYQIRYIWGLDNKTTLKDGTKVSVGEYKSTYYGINNSDAKWYLKNSGKSSAIDSWAQRTDFDEGLQASYEDYSTYNVSGTKLKNNMNSWSSVLDMGVEVVGQNNQVLVRKSDDLYKYNRYLYKIENIDFGLIERPKQQLQIKKELTHLRIKTAQGQTIVDAEVILENGKKTFKNIKDVLYTVLLPESDTNPTGTVKSEIDKDYMPVTLEATYTVSVINTSEKDYKNQGFYYSNKSPINEDGIVQLKAKGVYDYITQVFNVSESDSNYNSVTKETYNKIPGTMIEKGYSQYYSLLNDNEYTFTADDGTEIKVNKWNSENSVLTSLYREWWDAKTEKQAVRNTKLDGKNIINLQALEQELVAGQSVSSTYTVKSLVQNQEDEIKLDNDAEIIDIERTTGFGKTKISTYQKLYDGGEKVIITPPTGEDRSKEGVNILAISLASGLAVLGIGLIFIKRRISKHNKNA